MMVGILEPYSSYGIRDLLVDRCGLSRPGHCKLVYLKTQVVRHMAYLLIDVNNDVVASICHGVNSEAVCGGDELLKLCGQIALELQGRDDTERPERSREAPPPPSTSF